MQWIETSPSFWIRLVVMLCVLAAIVIFGGQRMQQQQLLSKATKKILALDDKSAIDDLREYERAYGKTAEVEFQLARAYRHLSEPERAKQQLEFARQLKHSPDLIRYEKILIDAQSGNMDEADSALDEILEKSGFDVNEVLAAYCYGNLIKMRFDRVGVLVASWIKADPASGLPYVILGMLAQYNQQWQPAKESFQQALKKNPNIPAAVFGLAETHIKLNEYDQAVPLYQRYLEIGKETVDAKRGLAESLLGSNRPEEALKLLTELVQQGDKTFDIRMLLGRTQFDLGRNEEAIQTLSPLRELWPEDIDLNYTLARAYAQTGQQASADSLFAKTEEGRAVMKDIDLRLKKAAEEPENAELRYQLGHLLMHYSSREEGRVWLQGALQIKPNLLEAIQDLEKYYSRKGDLQSAADYRNAILALGGSLEKSAPPKKNDSDKPATDKQPSDKPPKEPSP